jgi:hypothetical protein
MGMPRWSAMSVYITCGPESTFLIFSIFSETDKCLKHYVHSRSRACHYNIHNITCKSENFQRNFTRFNTHVHCTKCNVQELHHSQIQLDGRQKSNGTSTRLIFARKSLLRPSTFTIH